MTPELKAFALDLADLMDKHGGSIEGHNIELIGPRDDAITVSGFIDHDALKATVAFKSTPVTGSSVVGAISPTLG